MSGDQDRERRAYRIHGRVQGVGFRWSTTRRARDLGIGGTVRNRADGTVEVHAEGPAEDLETFRSWLGEGPRAARVQEVERIAPREELPPEFQIIR